MFGKPKGWEELSPEDRAWAKKISDKWEDWAIHSLVENRPERIKFLMKQLALPLPKDNAGKKSRYVYDTYYSLALKAVRLGRADLVQAVMAGHGLALSACGPSTYYFNNWNETINTPSDEMRVISLFAAAKTPEVWRALLSLNTPHHRGYVTYTALKTQCISYDTDSREMIEFHMKTAQGNRDDGIVFKKFFTTGIKSVENMELILAYASYFSGAQETLNEAVTATIENGDIDKTKLLLKNGARINNKEELLVRAVSNADTAHACLLLNAGADANYKNAQCLQDALLTEKRTLVALLLPHVRLDIYGQQILKNVREYNPGSTILDIIKDAVEQAEVAARLKKNNQNLKLKLVDSSTIAEIQELPAGLRLTTLFNFHSRQQICLIGRADEKGIPNIAVTSFNNVGNPEYIEKMRQQLNKLGGKADDVYRLPKQDISPKR